jgi:hypothetical protein
MDHMFRPNFVFQPVIRLLNDDVINGVILARGRQPMIEMETIDILPPRSMMILSLLDLCRNMTTDMPRDEPAVIYSNNS